MNTASRKQREYAAREDLILEAAVRLLSETGYQGLSMDRVAEAVEYSKGTIYQHFDCKEDLLAGLCLRSSCDLLALFVRAAEVPLGTRQRLIALSFAYQLYVRLHPLEFANMQTLKSAAVRERASVERRSAMRELEARIIGTVNEVVREALAAGDLELPPGLSCEELVFCLWSMQYGAAQLASTGIPLAELGIPDAAGTLNRFNAHLLHRLGWRQRDGETDDEQTLAYLEQQVFRSEVRQLDAGGVPASRKSQQ